MFSNYVCRCLAVYLRIGRYAVLKLPFLYLRLLEVHLLALLVVWYVPAAYKVVDTALAHVEHQCHFLHVKNLFRVETHEFFYSVQLFLHSHTSSSSLKS